MLSLIAGSFLYTQLDSLRMMRNLYDCKSSMYLTLGNENASEQSFQSRFPVMMLSDYGASS